VGVGGALLVIAGAPLFTDDAWWHLALGRAYASQGPWLAADPLLYSASGPPAPAAWLADLGLFGVHQLAGFAGLRTLHALLVAAILALAWSLLRRAGGSRSLASLGTVVLIALAGYRLFQLRPHLLSMLAAFACYRLLQESGAPASRRRIAVGVAVFALWANLHGGFLLGPILLAAGLCGIGVGTTLRSADARRRDRQTAGTLAVALVLGCAATLLNADGVGQHLAYFAAGATTPELGSVSDEWSRIDLFARPPTNLPPSETAWLLTWLLVVATPLAGLHTLWRWRRGETGGPPPALLGVAGAALLAMLLAVRFLWLALFPLLLIAAALRAAHPAPGRTLRSGLALAAAALLVGAGFFFCGDWQMISGPWPRSWGQYRQPYPSARYSGHAVGFLEDAGLSGNLFNEYVQGGYLGYRLAPRLKASINGSMNVPNEAVLAYAAIRQARGTREDESFAEVLERMRIDVFLGNRRPQLERTNRPSISTTAHPESTAGWLQVFRNLDSAVYLRDAPHNAENLERVARWYATQGVPYDRVRGFEPAAAIQAAGHWALRHGLVPVDLDQIQAARFGGPPNARLAATARLAALYATLGEYERALALDRELLAERPGNLAARRRVVWCLLRLDRPAQAHRAAVPLRRVAQADELSQRIAQAAKRSAHTPRRDMRAQTALLLPLFTASEARALVRRVLSAPPRPPRLGDD